MAILLEEEIGKRKVDIEYKIYATDIDEAALEKASKGIYTLAEMKGVSKRRISTFFDSSHSKFKIKNKVRKNIIFSKHDAVNTPPMTRMDFISCRNLMIYLDTEYKNRLVSSIQYALKLNGFLLLGKSESTSEYDNSFKKVNNSHRIYQNQNAIYLSENVKHWKIDPGIKRRLVDKRKISTIEEATKLAYNELIQAEYKNASVCVDENMTILYATGRLKRFVNFPDEGFTNNLSKILDDTLLIPILSAIRKIKGDTVVELNKLIQLLGEDREVLLKIIIKKLNITNYANRAFIITFLEVGSMPARPKSEKDSNFSDEEFKQLKETLNETRENLQLTIEELETSNEEMQATNEELLAANEELQSTNEELQSVNEELHTVNAELQNKNSLLIEFNDDFKNLLQNVQIGTLFLDRDLNIRRYTPTITEHFSLREQDLGRSIMHYSGTIQGSELVILANKVLETGKAEQVEIEHNSGAWYWIKVSPYVDSNNSYNGVTVNFINIDLIKRKSLEVEELYSFLKHVTQTTPAIVILRDIEKNKILHVSGNSQQILGYSEKAMLDATIKMKDFLHPEDLDLYKDHMNRLNQAKKDETVISQFKIIQQDTSEVKLLLVGSKAYERDNKGNVTKSLIALQDITSVLVMQEELKANEERLRLAVKSNKAGLWECLSTKENKMYWSPEYYALLGYDKKDTKNGYEHFLNILHEDSLKYYEKSIANADKTDGIFNCLVKLQHKDGRYEWFQINGVKEKLESNNDYRIISSIVNIHEKEIYKKVIESKNDQLQNIFDYSPVGYVTVDEKGTIKDCSKGFANFLEYDKSEIVNTAFTTYSSADFLDTSKDSFQKLRKFEIPFIKLEKKYITKYGNEKWGTVEVRPIKFIDDKGNSTPHYSAIVSDITDKKIMESQLNSVKNQSMTATQYFSRLVTNKLNQINLDLEKMEVSEVNGEYKSNVENLKQQLDSTQADVEELNIFYEVYNHPASSKNINLNKLLSEISKAAQKKYSNFNIRYDALPGITGDHQQIENLISKIIDIAKNLASTKTTKIDLQSSEKNDLWLFEFSFTVKPTKILKGLEQFFNEGQINDSINDIYLRLILCKSIVENHGGEFWFEENKNKVSLIFTLAKKGPTT